mgnify:CR=1 FL=1
MEFTSKKQKPNQYNLAFLQSNKLIELKSLKIIIQYGHRALVLSDLSSSYFVISLLILTISITTF